MVLEQYNIETMEYAILLTIIVIEFQLQNASYPVIHLTVYA